MILFIKLLKESTVFAWGSLVANKLRTLLTLLGITIGIFAIISVFSVVDALEKQIRSSIATLGDNVIYIQKWPWGFSGEYAWWQYMNRPNPRLHELDEIRRRTQVLQTAVFTANTQRTIEYMNRNIERVNIVAASHDYNLVRNFELEDGRYFTPNESATGRNVAILGFDIAQNLFPNTDPIGKYIKAYGRRIQVIGIFTKEGENTFGNSHDEMVLLPVNFLNSFLDLSNDRYGPSILAKARPEISNEHFIDELTGTMRAIRRLKPIADDNFALNETNLLSNQFDGLFTIIKMAGWIIGGFSILVGGFGIANIMFVSVKERTSIIGIQKALGSKRYFIMLQFMVEAVFLSLIGGAFGLLLVLTGGWIASQSMEMDLMLTTGNLLLGINVSAIIGLLAGFVPAWSASRLDPVEAIRSNG